MLCGEIPMRNAERQFAWRFVRPRLYVGFRVKVIFQARRSELIQEWSLPTESQEAKAKKWTLLTLKWGGTVIKYSPRPREATHTREQLHDPLDSPRCMVHALDLTNFNGSLQLWPRSTSDFDRKSIDVLHETIGGGEFVVGGVMAPSTETL
ncbi:hypothetical protein CI102_15105 [Trichoderma harzianum]|nr:hypothetical protein CI102_15105 [Trichoderma harzianum]